MASVEASPPGDEAEPGSGTLYLVPTPIGNPGDITLRAIEVLRRAGIVASEDTRHTRSLLQSLDIEVARLVSYHDHNEESRGPRLLAALRDGIDVAVVSDAGTPLVNDPGFRLVAAAVAEGIRVCPLPGASATITALIGSGLPVHRFFYGGFLPRKSASRQAALRELAGVDGSLIFFEAPHRIAETVRDMAEVFGERLVALARNLTKADESFIRGTLSAVAADLESREVVRGQYTVVVGGAPEGTSDQARELADRLADALAAQGVSSRQAREVVSAVTGLPRNQAYECIRSAEQRSQGREPG